jgi:hypothetical protein
MTISTSRELATAEVYGASRGHEEVLAVKVTRSRS